MPEKNQKPANHRINFCLQVGVALLISLVIQGCHTIGNALLCGHSIEPSVGSPSQRYVAEVISDDCGATSHATIVRIRVAGALEKKEVFIVRHLRHIDLSWKDDHTLLVACANCYPRDVGESHDQWHDLRVLYNLPSPPFSSTR
jgi:hypothetical protein